MQNVILWMPNTVLIWDGNEPLSPTSISIIPTSSLSNVSTGKSNLPGCWKWSTSQIIQPFSALLLCYNLRRPQDSDESLLPTKKILANSSSPGFAGFVTNSQGSPCLMLDEGESCSPARVPGHWDAGHHKSRPGAGARTSTPLGTWRPLVCHL